MLLAVDWMAAVGRLHPLVLHLPIGLLVALASVEVVRRMRGRAEPDASRGVLVVLLAISTFLAAFTGWLLHESDDYGDPVELHEWLGIALLVVSAIIAVAHRRASAHFGKWLALALLLLFPTAHFGASLTHGSGYLLEPWRAADDDAVVEADPDDHFAAARPFFATYCTRCHGESKQKGGLALHDEASLLAGGDDGPALIPGDPVASLLIERMHLPLDDDDHMPPEGKPQPSADEVAALGEWIAGLGGPLDPGVAQRLAVADGTSTDATETEQDGPADSSPERDAAALDDAVSALRTRLVHVAPLAADSPLYLVDYGAAQLAPGALAAQLEPLHEWIADLDLSSHELAPGDLQFVAQLPRLERLELRDLTGDPLELGPLAACEQLATLNLSGSTVLPTAVDVLASMPALETVFLWGTGIDSAALTELGSTRPSLAIHGASPAPDAPIEVEPEVVFEAYAAEPAAPLLPSNASCPITGKPVDPRYTIVDEGRVIGFCCPTCPAAYWAERDEAAAADEDR